MANNQVLINSSSFSSLAEELSRIGQSLVSLSQKLENLTKETSVKSVKVTPKTDPEMFTKEFIKKVRQSRRDFEEGRYYDYFEIRKTLGLK